MRKNVLFYIISFTLLVLVFLYFNKLSKELFEYAHLNNMARLNETIGQLRTWMIPFILLSGILIIYTTQNLLSQKYKTKTKEKEVEEYRYALDESAIVAITDQKGIIKYVNDNFCKISKYDRAELIGKDHRIINSGHHSKDFIRDLWVTIANGQIWKGELKNKAKDGAIYWVDTTIVPFLNEKGRPYQYVAIRADITERKQAEDQLVKSEKIYKTIASSIPGLVICILDKDYRYLLIEGDMLEKLGYSKKQLLGNKAKDVLPAELFETVENDFKKVLNGNTIIRESNRAKYDVISKLVPLKDESNDVYAIMAAAIDVTELKNAQRNVIELNRDLEDRITRRTEQLKKTNEELESFSYSVSHDLRTPLRAVVGYAGILEEDYTKELDEEGKRIITAIKENTLKMGRLIDDLLAFSRIGQKELVKTTIDFEVLVQEVIKELKPGESTNIKWDIHELPSSPGDYNTIRQVWINLISNAIKYSAKKEIPHIEIGSFVEEEQVAFFVKDNGDGFNEKYKNKLFKVFQRLHSMYEFEGTGVGLAIVEKIIYKHGGKVWAEGEKGKGACFYFSLPMQ